jgi:hypothetical protein
MPIGCDTALTVGIETPVDTDLLSFSVPNVSGGTRVPIRATNSSGPGSGTPSWRLLSRTGAPVPGNCALFAATKQRDCGPLVAGGNPYRIEVEDRPRDETATHQFYFQALTQGATCDTRSINCTVITGKINSRLDSDRLTFSVANGPQVRISMAELSSSGPKFDLAWRLLTKTGAPVSGQETAASSPGIPNWIVGHCRTAAIPTALKCRSSRVMTPVTTRHESVPCSRATTAIIAGRHDVLLASCSSGHGRSPSWNDATDQWCASPSWLSSCLL